MCCLIRGGVDLNALNARGLTPLALVENGPQSKGKCLLTVELDNQDNIQSE